MEKDGCCSSVVCNILSEISIDYVVLSVYCGGYLQLGLCDGAYYFFSGVGWYLDKIEDL